MMAEPPASLFWLGVKSAGSLRPSFKASPTEKKKVGSPDVLCCFRYRVRVSLFSIRRGTTKTTSTLWLAVVRPPPSLEFKTESRARGTMWLALLPPATKRAGDAFGGPPPGPQRGRRCSAPPFSFLLINSPASLISPDEMRPREHCPPAQPFGALIILPAGGRRGWRVRSCTRTETHRSTH